jgi:hypothetical protein
VGGSWEFGTNEWEPEFEIEFDEPRTLQTYADEVHILLQFLSAMACFQLTPTRISISPQTHAEFRAAIKTQTYEDYSVEYLWSDAVVERRDIHPRNSFAHAFSIAELEHLKACLAAWLKRQAEWGDATKRMMGSLGLFRESSGQRLLMACRWLEAIPGAKTQPSLDDSDIAHIAEKAAQAALERGHAGLEKRIRGALRRSINFESNPSRFERLLGTSPRRSRPAR